MNILVAILIIDPESKSTLDQLRNLKAESNTLISKESKEGPQIQTFEIAISVELRP